MIVPDGMLEVGVTAWLAVQGWTLVKLSNIDKKLAVVVARVNTLEAIENMKKTPPLPIIPATVVALFLLLVGPVSAQTNQPPVPPSPASLPDTIIGYFSGFNTNLTTFDNRFDLWTGASSIQGAATPLVNDLGLSYDLWRQQAATNGPAGQSRVAIDLEANLRNSGVAGSLVSAQGGAGLSILVYDVKLTLYGNGGYYLDTAETSRKAYAEIGLRAKKAIGQHFYLGVGVADQFPRSRQVYSAFAGATF